jgi:hypothetical protein
MLFADFVDGVAGKKVWKDIREWTIGCMGVQGTLRGDIVHLFVESDPVEVRYLLGRVEAGIAMLMQYNKSRYHEVRLFVLDRLPGALNDLVEEFAKI